MSATPPSAAAIANWRPSVVRVIRHVVNPSGLTHAKTVLIQPTLRPTRPCAIPSVTPFAIRPYRHRFSPRTWCVGDHAFA